MAYGELKQVARFTRAWIETNHRLLITRQPAVARFTRAWIETTHDGKLDTVDGVARFTRAWIETLTPHTVGEGFGGRPLHAGVD